VDGVISEKILDGFAKHIAGQTKDTLAIGRMPQNRAHGAVTSDETAVWLDGTGNVDRLFVAVRKIDLLHWRRHGLVFRWQDRANELLIIISDN
jgi:hypothetical protein